MGTAALYGNRVAEDRVNLMMLLGEYRLEKNQKIVRFSVQIQLSRLNMNKKIVVHFLLLFAAMLTIHACAAPETKQDTSTYLYAPPFEKGQRFLISQAFHGKKTHKGILNEYAVDIVMPVGTKVCAAREGVVLDKLDSYRDSDKVHKKSELIKRANYVKILHDDGTVAFYAHLKKGSIIVSKKQRLNKGQCFAQSGNSGDSTGPHLHFAILKNKAGHLYSLAFYFMNMGNIPTIPSYLSWLYS